MTFEEQYRLSFYQKIADISTHKNVVLVQHTESKKIYVRKEQTIYNKSVYEYLMQCDHPNIPEIYECVESDGTLILIEEYVQGDSLQELFDRKGPLDKNTVISYMITLCDILITLQKLPQPIIHRDLKPENIIIENNGSLKVIDFNSAKQYDNAQDNDTVIIGTRKYAAPEQYGFQQSDVRTDIYAIGIMLNYLLAGAYPPPVYQDSPVRKYSLTSVIQKCTAFSPAQRYQTMAALRYALVKSQEQRSVYKGNSSLHSHWNHPLLPPGFRTGTVWKMLAAILGYSTILDLSFSMTATSGGQPASGIPLWINRIGVLIFYLATVLFLCNYRNIHDLFPFMRNKFGKIVGMILMPCVLLILIALIVAFLT